MKALIDGDILRYRIGFAAQTTYTDIYMGADIHKSFDNKTDLNEYLKTLPVDAEYELVERIVADPVENCLHSVKLQLNSIIEGAKADEYKILLTGHGNFREGLVDYYKANRDRGKRPIHYDAITRYLIEGWNAKVVHRREADDALSILQYQWYEWAEGVAAQDETHMGETIICTIDKDLDMVPGWHYNFVDDVTYWVDEEDGLRNFYFQLLEGDSSDNIPGLSKITGTRRKKGEWNVHRSELLAREDEVSMWKYVKDCYLIEFCKMDPNEDTILTEDIEKAVVSKLRETGKLLWMQRTLDDDWEPPK